MFAATAQENSAVLIIFWHLIESFQNSCLFKSSDLLTQHLFLSGISVLSSLEQDVGLVLLSFALAQ